MNWTYNDGGHRDLRNGCVIRAIAIATGTPATQLVREFGTTGRIARPTYHRWLLNHGWLWQPCVTIGSGCRVHLRDEELPRGRLIARCSRHLVAVIEGVIHDTHDPSRGGTRCVYGYYYPYPK